MIYVIVACSSCSVGIIIGASMAYWGNEREIRRLRQWYEDQQREDT